MNDKEYYDESKQIKPKEGVVLGALGAVCSAGLILAVIFPSLGPGLAKLMAVSALLILLLLFIDLTTTSFRKLP